MNLVRRVTVIPVMYRDEHNWKVRDRYLLDGPMSPEQAERVRAALDRGRWFIPAQVGLDHLAEDEMVSFPSDADHPWHELLLDEGHVTNHPGPTLMSVEAFIELLEEAAAEGWDERGQI